ncbi:MAG: hypothetical protein ACRCUP_04125 [Mycoplasmatales bacterium]
MIKKLAGISKISIIVLTALIVILSCVEIFIGLQISGKNNGYDQLIVNYETFNALLQSFNINLLNTAAIEQALSLIKIVLDNTKFLVSCAISLIGFIIIVFQLPLLFIKQKKEYSFSKSLGYFAYVVISAVIVKAFISLNPLVNYIVSLISPTSQTLFGFIYVLIILQAICFIPIVILGAKNIDLTKTHIYAQKFAKIISKLAMIVATVQAIAVISFATIATIIVNSINFSSKDLLHNLIDGIGNNLLIPFKGLIVNSVDSWISTVVPEYLYQMINETTTRTLVGVGISFAVFLVIHILATVVETELEKTYNKLYIQIALIIGAIVLLIVYPVLFAAQTFVWLLIIVLGFYVFILYPKILKYFQKPEGGHEKLKQIMEKVDVLDQTEVENSTDETTENIEIETEDLELTKANEIEHEDAVEDESTTNETIDNAEEENEEQELAKANEIEHEDVVEEESPTNEITENVEVENVGLETVEIDEILQQETTDSTTEDDNKKI